MPCCGATLDEKSVPLGQGETSGELGVTHNLCELSIGQTHPGASRHPSDGGDFQRELSSLSLLGEETC